VNLAEIALLDFENPEEGRTWQPGENDLTGVRTLLDDGTWRYVLLNSDLFAFLANGQRPSVDVCLGATEFVVRITGLVGRRRPVQTDRYYIEIDPPARAGESAAWEQDRPLPPLRFTIPFVDLAFRNSTFSVDDGLWHRSTIPIPVVFTRVGRGEPGTGITFVPDEP
jgi:hypothetical protein